MQECAEQGKRRVVEKAQVNCECGLSGCSGIDVIERLIACR
jgi:hypothetical protein